MPLHGRLELYPVPKEASRADYGGSYYEEPEWWRKPRRISHAHEIKDMLKEMLFITKLFANQRRLWWLSYAFHLGIYCLAAWSVLLLAGAAGNLAGGWIDSGALAGSQHIDSGAWPVMLFVYLTSITGIVGLVLVTVGVGGLLLRRFFDRTLRRYTTPQEYFNLGLILAVVGTALFAWRGDWAFVQPRHIAGQLLTLQPLQLEPLATVHVLLLGMMFVYIPLSKMSHYVGKYFAFHKVLWENEPNLPGSKVEQEVRQAVAYRPTTVWAAPHVQANPAPTRES